MEEPDGTALKERANASARFGGRFFGESDDRFPQSSNQCWQKIEDEILDPVLPVPALPR